MLLFDGVPCFRVTAAPAAAAAAASVMSCCCCCGGGDCCCGCGGCCSCRCCRGCCCCSTSVVLARFSTDERMSLECEVCDLSGRVCMAPPQQQDYWPCSDVVVMMAHKHDVNSPGYIRYSLLLRLVRWHVHVTRHVHGTANPADQQISRPSRR